MRISCLLALSLSVTAFTVRGTAQSSTPALPAVPYSPYKFHLDGQPTPLFGRRDAQPRSNPFQLPELTLKPFQLPQPRSNPFRLPKLTLNPFRLPQNTLIASADSVPQITWRTISGRTVASRPRSEDICYAMRSYAYVRDNPTSDATRLAGSSTCQLATSTQLKAVIDPHIVTFTETGPQQLYRLLSSTAQ
jgi:hypothetical protein